jgi:hypothetical protein
MAVEWCIRSTWIIDSALELLVALEVFANHCPQRRNGLLEHVRRASKVCSQHRYLSLEVGVIDSHRLFELQIYNLMSAPIGSDTS